MAHRHTSLLQHLVHDLVSTMQPREPASLLKESCRLPNRNGDVEEGKCLHAQVTPKFTIVSLSTRGTGHASHVVNNSNSRARLNELHWIQYPALNKLDNANSLSLYDRLGIHHHHLSSSPCLISSMRHAHFGSTINDRANYDEKLFEAIAHFSSAALRLTCMQHRRFR